MRVASTLALLMCIAAPVAAGELADGWTPQALKEANEACTEGFVEGAWENTKQAQGVDPDMKMTPEIRKKLEPKIAVFRALCECTVRETAKKIGRKAYERDNAAVEKIAREVIETGVCKPPAE